MIFSPLNLEKELFQERVRQSRLIDDVHDILDQQIRADEAILERLKTTEPEKELNIVLDAEDRARIFSLTEIRNIAVRYRLRFLDSSFYKNEFPYTAVAEIKTFERKYGVAIQKFKIMAPDHAFNLEDINKDPLLFAQLTDGSYYLIHKWGRDLAWYKKYLFLPLQTPVVFFVTLFSFCCLCALSVPTAWMHILNLTSEVYLRIWLSLHLFIMFTGLCIWAGMAFDKNFSCNTWDSKYYNW